MKSFDLLIKGGQMIDPANKRSEISDIAISNGKILEIGANLPEEKSQEVVDAVGCIVTPGLIDIHSHLMPDFPAESSEGLYCINPDAHLFQSGVTTAVDAGTCGWHDFHRFKDHVIDKSRVRILCYLNIAARGMLVPSGESEPSEFHPEIVAAVSKQYTDNIIGVKSAHYWVGKPFDEIHTPWASADAAITAAKLCGKHVMMDFKPTLPERTYDEMILEKLRPGDIHTHMYAQQFPILNARQKVQDFCFKARERGVLFDLGHGCGSFWFRNAIPAISQGFKPDVISSDLYGNNVAGPVINLLHVMSKCMAAGMGLEEVIFCTTQRPAEIIGHPELGTLSIGSVADISIIQQLKGNFGFSDCGNASVDASTKLDCVMTVREGNIVFNPYGRAMPNWQKAPSQYRQPPGILPI